MQRDIALPPGHDVGFGARVGQMIRLAGARLAGIIAGRVVELLRRMAPPIRVWEAGLAEGHFALDPRCLREEELEPVARHVKWALEQCARP